MSEAEEFQAWMKLTSRKRLISRFLLFIDDLFVKRAPTPKTRPSHNFGDTHLLAGIELPCLRKRSHTHLLGDGRSATFAPSGSGGFQSSLGPFANW